MSKYKFPYVQVNPDGSTNIVNAPNTGEASKKDKKIKVKRPLYSPTEKERRELPLVQISTISTSDVDIPETPWICVFCKKGSNKMGLGDLFGPYIITTSCEEFEQIQIHPSEDEFVSKRMKLDMFQKEPNAFPVVPSSQAAEKLLSSSLGTKPKNSDPPNVKKSQEQDTSEEIFFGMTKVSDTTYEVWVHEDCVVWAPGTYLVGARVAGLDAAVWNSTKDKCSICSSNGAMICCFKRGCPEQAHIPCARTQNWTLNEMEFKSFCASHSDSSSAVLNWTELNCERSEEIEEV